ncbi:MAG: Lipopolysaccharide export system permease protein LptG [Syntrophaceae bacterium PtaU1.Bin231]|nr:MAG: Lipopolysaccharide export system permease protein LptG [Syntrophaceae bacterium PtaU1.Bin231]
MTVLDRYISREFILTFGFVLLAFLCLYMIVDFFERIRMFLSNSATLGQIVSYHLYTVPGIVAMMIPACVLLAALITFGLLSRNHEIVAMKANGISLYRIALPVMAFAIVACAVNFLLNEFVTPAANRRAEYIKYVEVQKKKEWGAFKENQIWYKSGNAVYNFKLVSPSENRIQGVTIHHLDAGFSLVSRIDAREARWTGERWELRDVLRTTFAGPDFPSIERLPALPVEIAERPEDLQAVQKSADQMGFRELRDYIGKLRREGYDATRYETDLHGKIAFVFVSLILALIGVSFPMRSERSGGIAQGIGIGVVIGFSYWIVFAFMLSLGRSGTLPPLVAAWATNVIFGIAAVMMFRKANQ